MMAVVWGQVSSQDVIQGRCGLCTPLITGSLPHSCVHRHTLSTYQFQLWANLVIGSGSPGLRDGWEGNSYRGNRDLCSRKHVVYEAGEDYAGGYAGRRGWAWGEMGNQVGWMSWYIRKEFCCFYRGPRCHEMGCARALYTGELLLFSPWCPLPACTTQLSYPPGRGAGSELHFQLPSLWRCCLKPSGFVKQWDFEANSQVTSEPQCSCYQIKLGSAHTAKPIY